MAFSKALKVLSITLLTLHLASAYIIDTSCAANTIDIVDAVDEALAITEYAAWRIENDKNKVDPFRKQVIGDNPGASDVYTTRMKDLANVVGPHANAPFTGPADRKQDSHILFKCGDGSARRSKTKSTRWYDKDFLNRFALEKYADGNTPICANGVKAMTADTMKSPDQPNEVMPHHIIYLCPAAFKDPATMGTDWKTRMWTGIQVERTARFLSVTILHELLHAQIGNNMKPDLLGKLPSKKSEQYTFTDIEGLTNDDKIANAHGYTLLASASFVKAYEIGTDGKMGKEWTPDEQPGKSLNDGHKE